MQLRRCLLFWIAQFNMLELSQHFPPFAHVRPMIFALVFLHGSPTETSKSQVGQAAPSRVQPLQAILAAGCFFQVPPEAQAVQRHLYGLYFRLGYKKRQTHLRTGVWQML